jgi:hypothetical protein
MSKLKKTPLLTYQNILYIYFSHHKVYLINFEIQNAICAKIRFQYYHLFDRILVYLYEFELRNYLKFMA